MRFVAFFIWRDRSLFVRRGRRAGSDRGGVETDEPVVPRELPNVERQQVPLAVRVGAITADSPTD